jgi:hypothetical protein
MTSTHYARLARFAIVASLALPGAAMLAAPPAHARRITTPQALVPKFAVQYQNAALAGCDAVEKNLPEITRVAEIVATRYMAGGAITWPWNGQSLQQEMIGRSGGMMHFGPDRDWKDRDAAGNAQNIILMGWDRAPGAGDLAELQKLKAAGAFLISFGPRDLPELKEHVAISDAWFDTGFGADDRVVAVPLNARFGRVNVLMNMLNGWTFEAELVAALTRRGKMPVMYQSYMVPEAHDWEKKHTGKQFHDNLTVAPVAPGVLGRALLKEVRDNIHRFRTRQNGNVAKAVKMILAENKAGRKTVVASMGHAPWTYLGKGEETLWSIPIDVEASVPSHVESYIKNAPEGALVLRLGYSGWSKAEAKMFGDKKQRVMLITTKTPNPDAQIPPDLPVIIDMEWAYGDAMVKLAGYPIKLFPPSGIMQIVAFESINTEVLAALPPVK